MSAMNFLKTRGLTRMIMIFINCDGMRWKGRTQIKSQKIIVLSECRIKKNGSVGKTERLG